MTAEKFISEGFALQKVGKYQEALDLYNKAIIEDPYSAPAFYAKGFVLEELGRYEEAIESYNLAISYHSSFYQAYNNKGSALIDLGMYQEAIISFDTVISLRPDFPQAYNNKGYALQCLGKPQEAIECFDKAIQLNHDDPQAHYNKGIALKSLGNYEEAIVSLEKARNLKSEKTLCLCYIASCKLSLGNDIEALEGFKSALREIENSSSKLKEIKTEDVDRVKAALSRIIGLGEAIKEAEKEGNTEINLSEVKEEGRRLILGINFQKVDERIQELDELRERVQREVAKKEKKVVESGLQVRNWPQTEGIVTTQGNLEGPQEVKSKATKVMVKKTMTGVEEKDVERYTTEGDDQKVVTALEFQNKNNPECCSIF